jgi:hypothetical protein
MEWLSSCETSVLTREHGVTSQKTPFFKEIYIKQKAKNGEKKYWQKIKNANIGKSSPSVKLVITYFQPQNSLTGSNSVTKNNDRIKGTLQDMYHICSSRKVR